MKKILIVGAGPLQSFVIKKAKELGYYTIAIDKNPNAIGFNIADEHKVLDIINQKDCLEFAKLKEIDGVMTAATDYGVLTTSYIAEKMGLPGLPYNIATIIKNKYEVRKRLHEKNVDDVIQHYEIADTKSLNNIKSKIKYPVMVKPTDGSGSKAAKRVDNSKELLKACEEAIKSSLRNTALIEDFIEGKEYGVESFVYNGKIHILGVIGKCMTSPPIYAELGHFFPSNIGSEEKIKEVVSKAISILDINFGPVNMDVLVSEDDNVCIVDIGARMGGNLIGSHIIPLGTGLDYMEVLIKSSVGDLKEVITSNCIRKIATQILALDPGKIKSIPDIEEIKEKYSVEIYHSLRVNENINAYKNNLDGFGYVVSVTDAIEESISKATMAKEEINSNIIRYKENYN